MNEKLLIPLNSILQDAGIWPCAHAASPVISPLVWESDPLPGGSEQWPNLNRSMVSYPIVDLDSTTNQESFLPMASDNDPASGRGSNGGGVGKGNYQKTVIRVSKERETLIIGTSHVARMEDCIVRNGCNVVAIRGGRLAELCGLVNRSNNLGQPKNVILICGGNDVQDMNGIEGRELSNAKRVAEGIEGLVKVCQQKFKDSVCVTGSMIPRMMGKGGGYRDRFLFVDQLEDVDSIIQKVHAKHHHFLTDSLVSDRCFEPRGLGMGGDHKRGVRLGLPKLDLFQRDKVHLNANGNEVLGKLLGITIDCLTFNEYAGRHLVGKFPAEGVYLWKF